MQVNAVTALKLAEKARIPVELQIRVETSLEKNPAAAELDSLLDFPEDLFMGQDIAAFLAGET